MKLAFFCLFLISPFAHANTLLWQQPDLDAITVYVPPANHVQPLAGQFALILWQPDPATSNGLLVPNTWSAEDKTGLYSIDQLGFSNKAGSSVAQVSGAAVGAYINSADIRASTQYKMMITPQVTFSPQTKPFVTANAIVVGLNVQVPTATDTEKPGSNSYVDSDLLFVDATTGTRISYSAGLFFHGHANPQGTCHIGFDVPSNGNMVNCPMLPNMPYMSVGNTSTLWQGTPWRGYRHFWYRISKAQFAAAIKAVGHGSENPDDYVLREFHLNAELHYQSAPASLGWSMKGVSISTTP